LKSEGQNVIIYQMSRISTSLWINTFNEKLQKIVQDCKKWAFGL